MVAAFATLSSWTLVLVTPFSSFQAWPRSGFRGNVERATVFFVVAAITRGTITNHQTRWQITLLAFSAAMIEIGRGVMIGRSNGFVGWVCSTVGIIAGAILMHHVAHEYFWRWGW